MAELAHAAQTHLLNAEHAEPAVVKALQQRWIVTNQVINQVLRYPEAAIDAAKDATQPTPDWHAEGENIAQQAEQWQ